MLWLQSSMMTVAHELWYSLCATIRSVVDVDRAGDSGLGPRDSNRLATVRVAVS